MRLYYSPGACSLAPHIVAREAGIDLELIKVDLASKRTEAGDDYASINPMGSVPAMALSNDQAVLTEAAVLMQYLADSAPQQGLLPPQGSIERYRALEWLNFIATELHKAFGPLWRTDTPSEMREIVKATLAIKFNHLDKHLGSRTYLLGDRFSAADAYAFTVLSWAAYMNIDLARWPNVSLYVQRVAERPRVRDALRAEGILTEEAAAA